MEKKERAEDATHQKPRVNRTKLPDGPPDLPTLDDLTVAFFTVSPLAISAGAEVSVSWQVTIPPKLVGVTFFLNGLEVRNFGDQSFRPIGTTTYALGATQGPRFKPLAHATVTVDTSPCTKNIAWDLRSFQSDFLQPGVFKKLEKAANFQIPGPGPVTISIWINDKTDATIEYEGGTKLLKLTLPLEVSLNVAPGNGSIIIVAWYSLGVRNGLVVPEIQNLNTDLSLPLPLWGTILLFLLGPEAAIFIVAVLKAAAPNLVGGLASPVTEAFSQVFALFGKRAVAIRLEPIVDDPDPTNINLVATVCP